jgi:hypothetical protein
MVERDGRFQNLERHLIRGHCMCKEVPVIPFCRVGGPIKNNGKKWRAEKEKRPKGLLTPPPHPRPPPKKNNLDRHLPKVVARRFFCRRSAKASGFASTKRPFQP